MGFSDLKIGVRMGVGFGLLITMMLVMVVVAVLRFSDVGEINDRIIEKDWVKAEASNVINATTRANARRTMELVIATNPEQIARVKSAIDANKKTIASALETLDSFVICLKAALVAKLKEARTPMWRPSPKWRNWWMRASAMTPLRS